MKDSKTIKINGEKVEIKKIPLKRFSDLIKAVRNLPMIIIENFQGEELTEEAIIQKVPELIGLIDDDIINCVSVASGIEKEILEEVGIDEFLVVVNAVLEINNIQAIVGEVKNSLKILQKFNKKK